MNKFYALLLSFLLLSLISHQLIFSSKKPQDRSLSLKIEAQTPLENNDPLNQKEKELNQTFEAFSLHMAKRKEQRENKKSTPPLELFSEIKDPTEAPKRGINALFAIKLNTKELQNLQIGTRIHLPLFEAINYTAKIEERKRYADGTLSLRAKIEDEYESYSAIITLGRKNSFATFYTPEGAFELEAKGEIGYIYATEEIDKQWIDYDQEDTLALTHS